MSTPASTPAIPRPAATIILLRDGAAGLEVLLICRAREVAFASGALVFPGGRVEEADALLAPPGDPLGAFRVGAIREAWEETGVLLAHPPAPVTTAETEFHALLRDRGVAPAHGLLTHFAHWITPAHSPKRFDTHFFVAEAPEGQIAVHDGHEAVEAVWMRPGEAVEEADSGRRTLVFATRLNLLRLARSGTVAEAIAAARITPIVTVTPQPEPDGAGGVNLRIPLAAGYGADLFPAKDRPASGGLWPGQSAPAAR
ncbi:NUDIX hydrolase [Roseococcus pinisoli]|uniref:NUDIX domain-containing protein n=1 Tax=Roseococcus pinisoli TaxID=2835040 RepID=A0ABS5QCV6_9PROT|nr:NUDIX domain-containing protein [Roseococcus pinisoli]MBS7811530.1 NUDIX domain-containing protein [Roseococcus pinisoli]